MNKNILFFALKFIISGALIAFLLSNLDLAQIGARLSSVHLPNIALAGLSFLLLLLNNSARWRVILSTIDRNYLFAWIFKIQYIGAFFNQTLPSAIGGMRLEFILFTRPICH